MKKNYTPWQSWSPPTSNIFGLPTRDYCPVRELAQENKKPPTYIQKAPISGWCSWYHYGKEINEKNLEAQAIAIKAKNPALKYFLIDDGWCRWGDWISPDPTKFPNLPAFTDKLRHLGFKPGIWLAPFLVDPSSYLATAHPDWLIRNSRGRPVNRLKLLPFDDFLPWKKYVLDFSIPEVKQYIFNCLDYLVGDLGISLIKLDFLYAPYFHPGLADDRIPHQHLVDIFNYIKLKYPNVYTLACGCPYKPARFLVDAIRIGKDISWPQLNNFPLLDHLVRNHRFRLLKGNYQILANQSPYFHLDPDVHLKRLPLSYYRLHFGDVFFSGDSYL